MKAIRTRHIWMMILALLFTLALAGTAAAKVKLNETALVLKEGSSYQLKISGTSKKVSWSSSNKKVVTVSSKGKVKARKAGEAVITAKVSSKKYKCRVTVLAKTAHQAYRLRNYILEKGKKQGSERYILWKEVDDEESEITARISATPDQEGKELIFEYSYVPDTASYSWNAVLMIDLAAKKEGRAWVVCRDLADDTGWEANGIIRTDFDGSGKGFALEEYSLRDINENYDSVLVPLSPEEVSQDRLEAVSRAIARAFPAFDELLKETGHSFRMANIGFTKMK